VRGGAPSAGSPAPAEALQAEGFQRVRRLRTEDLPERLRRHPRVAALGEGLFLLAALSCHREEPDDPSAPGEPCALVAPFARRHYYRDAVVRLKRALAFLAPDLRGRPGPPPRLFSNSRLPEKPLAAACGLGSLGFNSLVIAPGLGSAFVIAGVFLPAGLACSGAEGSDRPLERGQEAAGVCGSCRACLEACPVGAITAPGEVDRSRCLQALATRLEPWPPEAREAWGFRLYGCQACQDACPYNRNLRLQTQMERGAVGAGVRLSRLLGLDEEGIRALFRGTALGMSWIPPAALLRNALVAAAHRGDRAVLGLVKRHLGHPLAAVGEAARWAEERLDRG
jgi:epoxyqueuosine reductase